MPVVAESLRREVDARARAVEDADLVAPFVFHHAVNLDAEVEAGTDVGSDGVEGVGENDLGRERCGHHGKQRFAKGSEIGVGEWSLEFADAHADCLFRADVGPCLLKNRSTRSGGVD